MLPVPLFAATTRIDLTCTLRPEDKKMAVKCTLDVLPQYISKGRLSFMLSDRMGVPQVSVQQGTKSFDVTPTPQKTEEHDVTYEIPVESATSATRLTFSYESKDPSGFVYLLSPKECFAGGYNTLWFPSVGDSRKVTGHLTFVGPSSYLVKASGKEVSSDIQGADRSTKFDLDVPIVPTFAAAPFKVTRVPGKVPVTLYLLKDRPDAQSFATGCADVLKVLQKEFGPYPYPDFSIIETPSPESSQLGFSGASFEGFMFGDSDNLDNGFQAAYFGHEMGHQWWGNLVEMKGDKGSYAFGEGLAQYGSLQVVKALKGTALAEQYRRTGYPLYSDSQCLTGYLGMRANEIEWPLSDDGQGHPQLMHELANSKGFLTWETFAQAIGRDNFRRRLHAITSRHPFSSLTWDELWNELGQDTDSAVKQFRQEWFEREGIPVGSCDWKAESDNLLITVRQQGLTYRWKAPIVVTYLDGTTDSWTENLEGSTTSITRPKRGEVSSVEVDPQFQTLHSTPELDASAQAIKAFSKVFYIDPLTNPDPQSEAKLREALTSINQPDISGAEFYLRFGLAGVLRQEKKYDEAKSELVKALQLPLRSAQLLPYAYLRLALICDAQGQAKEADIWLLQMVEAIRNLGYPSRALDTAKFLFPNRKL